MDKLDFMQYRNKLNLTRLIWAKMDKLNFM